MRRLTVVTLIASALTCALAFAQMKGKGDPTLVYIGTYTGEKAKGIYLFRLQSEGDEVFQNVTLVPLGLVAETPNPSFIELNVRRRLLFAVNEVDSFEGKPTGAVSAYAIDPAGKLTLINQRSSMGRGPCQSALEKEGRYILVANCGSGDVAVFPIASDGRLGELTAQVDYGGQGAPCLAFDPAARFVLVCDRAEDKIYTYGFNIEQGGRLTLGPMRHHYLEDSARPSRVVFGLDARFIYVLNERHSSITVFTYDAPTGALTEVVQTISTVPEYFDGPNTAGELYMHRSGKWLYASNSGHNSVVLFTVDKDKGTLTFVEEQGTGGKNPRFFGMEPSSKHLAISNVDSDTVLASRIDEGNGRLKPSGIFATLPSPASVRFLPPAGPTMDK